VEINEPGEASSTTPPQASSFHNQGGSFPDIPEESIKPLSKQRNNPDPKIPYSRTAKTPFQRLKARLQNRPSSMEVVLFGVALLVYLITHFVGLTRFPIYFFSDEAIQTVTAANLLRDNLLDEEGTFMPTYFKNGPFINLSISVYAQVMPYMLFGKSVFITRATSILISLLAAISISLMLRNIYKVTYWWAGVSLLSITPAWFLHSRTAFETVMFVSFYAACLYSYLLYRYRSPYYLYLTILLAVLAFYTYSPGQVIVGLTGILLLISDLRFHWRNRETLLGGLGLAIILALPYIRFRVSHHSSPFEQLRILDSYWLRSIPLKEKISQFGSEYLLGLNPGYWFLTNERDLVRHLMKGYGHILLVFLPFAVIGLILAIRHIKSPAYRTLLISLLVAPVGAALVQIGITRILVLVIPATLLIALGLSRILTWLENKRFPHKLLSYGLFTILTFTNFFMLRDALVNSPTWYQDYGLGGMQYGAQQLFPKISEYLVADPQMKIMLSPNWANGSDVLARFFLGEPLPIQMGSIDGFMYYRQPLDGDYLLVMMPEEYQQAKESGKFANLEIEETLPYPNGKPGFYFVRLEYVDEIDMILEEERRQRSILRSAQLMINGEPVKVRYSMLDIGEVDDMFDGDQHSLGRTFEANPAVVEVTYPTPRSISGVSIIIGSTEAEIKALLYPSENSDPVEFINTFQGSMEQPEAVFAFEGSTLMQILRLEVRDLRQEEPANVHIWEIKTIH
jgi:4-amino-4-deoxy-L-arabinose transferase-like glycosyltransferase